MCCMYTDGCYTPRIVHQLLCMLRKRCCGSEMGTPRNVDTYNTLGVSYSACSSCTTTIRGVGALKTADLNCSRCPASCSRVHNCKYITVHVLWAYIRSWYIGSKYTYVYTVYCIYVYIQYIYNIRSCPTLHSVTCAHSVTYYIAWKI